MMLLSCTSPETLKEEPKDNNTDKKSITDPRPLAAKFDSVKYFRDADWTSLEGRDSISSDQLSYPFTRVAYADDRREVSAYFDENLIRTLELHKYQDLWYQQSKHYVRDIGDTMHFYGFYTPKGLITISGVGNPFDSLGFECRFISFITRGKNNKQLITRSFFPSVGRKRVQLDNVLKFEEKTLKKIFEEYLEETLAIEGNNLFVIRQVRKNFKKDKSEFNNRKTLRMSELSQPSFFYYFMEGRL